MRPIRASYNALTPLKHIIYTSALVQHASYEMPATKTSHTLIYHLVGARRRSNFLRTQKQPAVCQA